MLLPTRLPIWWVIIGTAALIMLLLFFFLLFIQYSRRQMEHVKQLKILQQNFEHTLLQSQLEIQEQTFTNISQEIHDNIGQVLSLVRLNIRMLEEQPDKQRICQTDELVGKAIRDLRAITQQLNTDYIKEAGIVEAIRQLLISVEQSGKFKISFKIEEACFNLDENKAIILFRIMQEIINNIIKHSEATAIDVVIEGNETLRSIRISDNGKGFDTAVITEHRAGLGISNMIYRSKIIGVEVDIKSSFGQGTVITIHNKNTSH
jgi:signal transduction histidine kinase